MNQNIFNTVSYQFEETQVSDTVNIKYTYLSFNTRKFVVHCDVYHTLIANNPINHIQINYSLKAEPVNIATQNNYL